MGQKQTRRCAFKPRLLQEDEGEYRQDKYSGDNDIRNTVSHAHCVRRSDDFRHVQNLFNETMRRHTSHRRMMQAVTSKKLKRFLQVPWAYGDHKQQFKRIRQTGSHACRPLPNPLPNGEGMIEPWHRHSRA
jgi:hypothetical protein